MPQIFQGARTVGWRFARRARGATEIDKGGAFVELAIVVDGRTDDHVGKAIAIDITSARHAVAQVRLGKQCAMLPSRWVSRCVPTWSRSAIC